MKNLKNALTQLKASLQQSVDLIDKLSDEDPDLQMFAASIRGSLLRGVAELNGKLHLLGEPLLEGGEQSAFEAKPVTTIFGKSVVPETES
jgi:hypothetical protein